MLRVRAGTTIPLQMKFYREDNTPLQLVGVVSVTMKLVNVETGIIEREIPCTIIDEVGGVVEYEIGTVPPGVYERRFEIKYNNGEIFILPTSAPEYIMVFE